MPLSELERSTDTLYVNNIPFETTRAEVAETFEVPIDSVVVPMRRVRDRETGKSTPSDKFNRGMAFITFQNLPGTIAEKAAEYTDKQIGDRTLVVDVAVVRPEVDSAAALVVPAAEDADAAPAADETPAADAE